MKHALLAAALLAAFPAAASADAVDDGNQGLAALQQGDAASAIADFSRAIASGQLQGDDAEFAYANRGKAYMIKADYDAAVDDLAFACQMKPDDLDAQSELQSALQAEIPANTIPHRPKANFLQALGAALLAGAMAGIAAGAQGSQ